MNEDVLGPGYTATVLPLGADDEGEVVAVLVTRRAPRPTRRAVLYVHGFADYFFQTHLADFYLTRGFDFYALDLRKYGRALRPYQTPNFVRSISEYFAELDAAIRIIRADHDVVLVNGHSTGGLTAALWADRVRGRGLVQGLFLNSPFFELPGPDRVRGPAIAFSRVLSPRTALPARRAGRYVESLHRDFTGEWDFDLAWKPRQGFPIRAGWLGAVLRAHHRLHAGLEVGVPALVMASARSVRRGGDMLDGDAVLDVGHIVRWSARLGDQVTVVRVDGGLHDLVLSPAQVRTRVFAELAAWIDAVLAAERPPP